MKTKTLRSLLLSTVIAALALSCSVPTRADDLAKDTERLENSGQVAREIMNIPDDIPLKLLNRADCVIVIPSVLKAAFIVGGGYGRGAMTCRSGGNFRGPWGPPTMMALEGGSFGFQIGAQATDFVLLVMNRRGAGHSDQQVNGGDATVAAGPVGRDAEADTDATFRAEILTYSRSRGLFAGISLEGSTLRPDNDANERIYHKRIRAKEIALHNEVAMPRSVTPHQYVDSAGTRRRSCSRWFGKRT